MTREDIERLLGGYATGTLTEQERSALFEAALSDQGLFDALMREQALAEVLDDPRCRRQIVAALEERPSLAARALAWLRGPRAWALVGSTAAVVVLAVAVIRVGVPVPAPAPKMEVALVKDKQAPEMKETEVKPAEPTAPLRRFEAPPARRERRAAAEVPPPPELEAAVPPAAPHILGRTAGAPAPPPADARQMFVSRPAAEAADTASRMPLRAEAYGNMVRSAVVGNRPVSGFGLRYSVERRRLSVEASQGGYLYVLGGRGLLFTTSMTPGKPYSFEVPADETNVFLVLSRQADPGPPDTQLARTRAQLKHTMQVVRKADKASYVVDPRGALVLAEVPLPE